MKPIVIRFCGISVSITFGADIKPSAPTAINPPSAINGALDEQTVRFIADDVIKEFVQRDLWIGVKAAPSVPQELRHQAQRLTTALVHALHERQLLK